MKKVFKYSIYDLFRSLWIVIYFLFFLITSFLFLSFSTSFAKAIVSLLSVTLAIVPLVSLLFGVMYFYSSREFVEILLAQPMRRTDIFLGQVLAIAVSLSVAFAAGILIPFAVYGVFISDALYSFISLVVSGILVNFIFAAIAFWVSLKNENRIKGFGFALLIWLFFAVIYDGIFLAFLIFFQDYPLETPCLIFSLFNPIDLLRITVLLKLEISSLMGYTGALFKEFFGTSKGIVISLMAAMVWIILPLLALMKTVRKKDF